MAKSKKRAQENANKVAEKQYDPSDYGATSEIDQGTAVTHEQVTDTYTEGTIDGHIDNVTKDGSLKNKQGKEIPREGF
ncbi:YozQ family protein [Terribacillus sp. DMT04]|uniref:YozQ family protein n=1 Tax=Terribacillus sp. DMT04 TaxID=2850441 RepID=UPI001C2C618F|nr:YozQ family protein [Terribacillus sp. DMT04]QXE02366.1 YozQ family protein [Terribacillus sp. DMT04]